MTLPTTTIEQPLKFALKGSAAPKLLVSKRKPEIWLTFATAVLFNRTDDNFSGFINGDLPLKTNKLKQLLKMSLFMFRDSILADCQHGFRSQRSCEIQLVQLVHDIISNLDGSVNVDTDRFDHNGFCKGL